MTRRRNDEHSTEFGLWLRDQKELPSSVYAATNLDFMWMNHKTGKWLLIEEKRHGSDLTWSQKELMKVLHLAIKKDRQYCGIHLLQFENTSPDDGKIYLNRSEISKQQLIDFLKFGLDTAPKSGKVVS